MIRSKKIRCFIILVLTFLVLQVRFSKADESVPSISKSLKDVKAKEKDVEEKKEAEKLKITSVNNNLINNTGNVTSKHATKPSTSGDVTTSQSPVLHPNDNSSLNIGALKRAFIVIGGLCGLVIMYIVFRSFRINKFKPQMVRKYGVLAHRQDVEMRPLPLDEDDEDDTTIFDASNISAQRLET